MEIKGKGCFQKINKINKSVEIWIKSKREEIQIYTIISEHNS